MRWDHLFHGPNLAWAEQAYLRWLADPHSVSREWAERFSRSGLSEAVQGPLDKGGGAVSASIADYAGAIRSFGHLVADVNPLQPPPTVPKMLRRDTYGLTDSRLANSPADAVGGPVARAGASAFGAVEALKEIYSGSTGYDFDHVRAEEERVWLRTAVESGHFRPPEMEVDAELVLDRLVQVEVFEQFLHRVFPGKHRFSIEGLDILVPMLDELVRISLDKSVRRFFIGMAHRGRLSVLAHILCEPYERIFAEFKDPLGPLRSLDDLGWTGDVKYHRGASRVEGEDSSQDVMSVHMSPNPSHVEAINPVVMGMVRAAISSSGAGGQVELDPSRSVAVEIHGDAAFPGQGITAETLNMSRLDGYWIGGSIHIIANNQLGYTTEPLSARSTHYASDLAKGFNIPILHVNADDSRACIEAVRLADAYRRRFEKDFVIDLIGYRRYGHNEGDEPSFTQPVMYREIKDHPRAAQILAKQLLEAAVIEKGRLSDLRGRYEEKLREVYESLMPDTMPPEPGGPRQRLKRGQTDTNVDAERLRSLHGGLLLTPEDFELHPKLSRFMERRRSAVEEQGMIDWATAEQLAFASLLEEGIPIRLTGEDVVRGTFSQRHLAFHDYESGKVHLPLQNLSPAQASFEAYNSPLTENAALAFEYGFDVESREHLVLWEAQYGDFINNAQMVVDEFISSGASKWRVKPSLVLLLPHGMEGAGPDHSSGRMERFLTLSTDSNLRIVNPTTAAQYFHLLRQQGRLVQAEPLPLIVFTPKSLLRAESTSSPISELEQGQWLPVIDDERWVDTDAGSVSRVILCSGKIYHDLSGHDGFETSDQLAVVRIEQLAPFPAEEIKSTLARYSGAQENVWVQEEPQNMGAWTYIRGRILDDLGVSLDYIGRPVSASPAEGSAAWHANNQGAILDLALDVEREGQDQRVVAHKETV